MHDRPSFAVLIAGGGCAALEAAFRLQHVAEGRVQTTVVHTAVAADVAARGLHPANPGSHVLTFGGPGTDEQTDVPGPAYELALMTAERAYGLCQRPELTFATAEPASLDGLSLEGLPHDAHGFLVVDRHGRVRRAPDVYAAGDVTHHPIKQGGLACQQADAAADAIAAQAGAAIEPELYEPLLKGVLLTERTALLMCRESRDDTAACTAVPRRGRSWLSTKIAGRELAVHLSDPHRDATAPAINTPPSAEIARPSA